MREGGAGGSEGAWGGVSESPPPAGSSNSVSRPSPRPGTMTAHRATVGVTPTANVGPCSLKGPLASNLKLPRAPGAAVRDTQVPGLLGHALPSPRTPRLCPPSRPLSDTRPHASVPSGPSTPHLGLSSVRVWSEERSRLMWEGPRCPSGQWAAERAGQGVLVCTLLRRSPGSPLAAAPSAPRPAHGPLAVALPAQALKTFVRAAGPEEGEHGPPTPAAALIPR